MILICKLYFAVRVKVLLHPSTVLNSTRQCGITVTLVRRGTKSLRDTNNDQRNKNIKHTLQLHIQRNNY